jgi:hypothetical protein
MTAQSFALHYNSEEVLLKNPEDLERNSVGKYFVQTFPKRAEIFLSSTLFFASRKQLEANETSGNWKKRREKGKSSHSRCRQMTY